MFITKLPSDIFAIKGDNGLPEAMDGVALDSNEEAVSLQPPVGTPSSTAVAATAEPMEELADEATTTTEGSLPKSTCFYHVWCAV